MDGFEPQAPRKKPISAHVVVLTLKETRHWHSPYSAYLREWRRARIFARAAKKAYAAKRAELLLYDAHENLLIRASSGFEPERKKTQAPLWQSKIED